MAAALNATHASRSAPAKLPLPKASPRSVVIDDDEGTDWRRHCERRVVVCPTGEVADPYNGTLADYISTSTVLREWARRVIATF